MSDSDNVSELYNRTRNAAYVLHAQATELLELAKELEPLTEDTSAWYAGTRASSARSPGCQVDASTLQRDLPQRIGAGQTTISELDIDVT